MEVKVKDLSYGVILSHIIPGIFLEMEIFLSIELFTPYKLFTGVLLNSENVVYSVVTLVWVLFLGILLGFVLDGIHHLFFEDIGTIFKSKSNQKNKENDEELGIFQLIKTSEQLQIYNYIDNILFFPYEAYANIFIAMIPGVILLPYWLCQLKFALWLNLTFTILYIIIFVFMLVEAKQTYNQWLDAEKKLRDFISKQD